MQYADFYNEMVLPFETRLLSLPLGSLFNGVLYDLNGAPIVSLQLPNWKNSRRQLSSADIARLFMAPDESVVSILYQREQSDGTPAGVNVVSTNNFLQAGESIVVVAYSSHYGSVLRFDALYLRQLMLAEQAPERFCTIAFALQACTAFRLGFSEIRLFAGGQGFAGKALNAEDLIGYQVWPKLGFDSPLQSVDLNRHPQFKACRSVLDVVELDSAWWASNGRALEMQFDLAARSRSWQVLLDYVSGVLPWEQMP